jgi:hypothetical protein
LLYSTSSSHSMTLLNLLQKMVLDQLFSEGLLLKGSFKQWIVAISNL